MRLLSVNIGSTRHLKVGTRNVLSAIGKSPVDGAVPVGRLGLAGDEQADPAVHGGLAKAVYAYPVEHYARWQLLRREHGACLFDASLPHGFLGENLTLAGLLESDVWIGDELHFPDCVLRVTAPREPCFKLNTVMGMTQAGKLMVQHMCPGFYLAVQEPGSIKVGQSFRLQPGARGLGVIESFMSKRVKHLR